MREARRAEVEKWKKEEPDKRLIMHREGYEFLYGDEGDFRKKYRYRRRNTEAEFEEHFAKPMRGYFAQSSIRHLPYVVGLHSDDLYTPRPKERDNFCKWLEDEIRSIDKQGAPSWHSWVIDRQGPGLPARYTASYLLHKAAHESDVDSVIDVKVTGPGKQNGLQVHINCDGGLNLDAIDRNIKEARSQLKDTASREQNPNIARIVVLAFATGIDPFDWEELLPHIAWLLEEYCGLSAIAVLVQAIDGTPRFIVYHNSWLRDDVVERLDTEAFNHEWSNQHSPSNGSGKTRSRYSVDIFDPDLSK